MKVAIGSDHAGYPLKAEIVPYLAELGHEVLDLGTNSTDSTDYPIYGARVGRAVVDGDAELGIVICGSGIGISIAANKVRGVRAGACSEPYSARMARKHNNANVIGFGARVVGVDLAKMIVDEFLATPFAGERHTRRVAELTTLDGGEAVE